MSLAPGLFRYLYELHRLPNLDSGQIVELARPVGRKGLADAGSMGEPDRPRERMVDCGGEGRWEAGRALERWVG